MHADFCGFRGDGTDRCTCAPGHVARYRSWVSGPLLDRIDLHMSVRAADNLGLSARGYHRILKVARTVADLEGSEAIEKEHAAEAVQYRAVGRWEMV